MVASRPTTFPSSNSIIRPPEISKANRVTTSTVPPSVNCAGSHRNASNHAGAQPSQPAKSSLGDRRARPPLPPLRIDLLANQSAKVPHEQGGKTPTTVTVAFHAPSAPIPIPGRQKSARPITPLTAREPKGGHFPFIALSPAEPANSRKSREYFQQHLASASSSTSAAVPASFKDRQNWPSLQLSETQRIAKKGPNMHDQQLPRHNPLMPFSPAMPLSPLQTMDQNPRMPRRAGKDLHLTSLPRFHPANYQSAESSPTGTPRVTRSSASQRQGSDVSQQLHQYRRDLVDGATRSARSLLSPKLSKPSPPRLHPLGSPGPVTPLVLEGQDDYLMGGTVTSPRSASASEGRQLVDRLIREEQDRIKHLGIRSARHSAAVSPAGVRR